MRHWCLRFGNICHFKSDLKCSSEVVLRENSLARFFIDLGDRLAGIDVMDLAEFLVKFDNGLRALIEVLQSLSEGLGDFVLTLHCRVWATVKATLHQGVLIDIVEEHWLTLANILLEVNSLLDRARETVNQIVLWRVSDQSINKNLNCKLDRQLVRHGAALGPNPAELLTFFWALNES